MQRQCVRGGVAGGENSTVRSRPRPWSNSSKSSPFHRVSHWFGRGVRAGGVRLSRVRTMRHALSPLRI